jgi:general secretion pathway protein B
MSFILDALKKLEEKRQRGSVPDLMTIHAPVPQEIKKRLIWPYLIVGALILNAALLLVWLHPWKPSPPSPAVNRYTAPQSTEVDKKLLPQRAVTVKIPAVKPDTEAERKEQVTAKTGKQKSVPAPSPKLQSVNAETPVKTIQDIQLPKTSSGKTLNAQPPQESLSAHGPKPSEAHKTMPANGIPELNQLPPALQNELPRLKISGHVYSNSPDTRLININGSIYKEGDTVAKNLKVVEITETGVVLDYNGTRFLMRAF